MADIARLYATPALPRLGMLDSVEGITADSRAVRPGFIFAALKGTHSDGRDFIADAVARGAIAVLAEEGTSWPSCTPPRPLLTDTAPRRRLAEIAAQLAGPLPRSIVAVTGTNGKTSSVDFLRQIMTVSGRQAASVGTLGVIAKGLPHEASLTTPDPVHLANRLARLRRAGIDHVALEASSHGLDQARLDGLRFAAAGFTNFTRDHLDYHGSVEAYRVAKLRLFADLVEDGAPALAMSELEAGTLDALREIAARRHLRFGTVGENGTVLRLLDLRPEVDGQVLAIEASGCRRDIALPLAGRFQAENALLAAALARAIGIEDALEHLSDLAPVRGRLERAAMLANGAAAYVDYAHTPDAIARVLTALRPHARGKLVIVFGAGGDRDRGKRPLMGEAAARFADAAIVTDDNPRSEEPGAIRAEILAACPDATEIADRRAAIEAGLAQIGPGDVLIVAGKGHEQGQIVRDTVIPFDDVSVIRSLVA